MFYEMKRFKKRKRKKKVKRMRKDCARIRKMKWALSGGPKVWEGGKIFREDGNKLVF